MSKRPPVPVHTGSTQGLEWRLDGDVAACVDAPMVLALHGQGMTADYFVGLLKPLLQLPLRMLTPRAPLTHTMRGTQRKGPSWYAYDGNQQRFRAELERTEELLAAFQRQVEGELRITPRERVLLGFSQGGYCGAFVALRRPELFSGMVISGARVKVEILAPEIEQAGRNGFAVLLCHGERDASVDPSAARSSCAALRAAGVPVELQTFDSGHALSSSQAVAIRNWLAERWNWTPPREEGS